VQTTRETLVEFTAHYAQALGDERYTPSRTTLALPGSSSSSAEATHFGCSAPASTEGRVLKRGDDRTVWNNQPVGWYVSTGFVATPKERVQCL
jgi:hypothetical protein